MWHNQLRNYLQLDSLCWWSMSIPCTSGSFFFLFCWQDMDHCLTLYMGSLHPLYQLGYMKSILPPSFNSFLYTNRAQVDKTKYDKNLDLTCSIPRSTFLWNKSKIASVSTANKGSKNIIFERRLTLLFRKPWSWYKTGDSSLQNNGTQTN